MADRYTFDQALREAQDSLSGEHGIVSVEDEGGSIVARHRSRRGPLARGRSRQRLPQLAPQGGARPPQPFSRCTPSWPRDRTKPNREDVP